MYKVYCQIKCFNKLKLLCKLQKADKNALYVFSCSTHINDAADHV